MFRSKMYIKVVTKKYKSGKLEITEHRTVVNSDKSKEIQQKKCY